MVVRFNIFPKFRAVFGESLGGVETLPSGLFRLVLSDPIFPFLSLSIRLLRGRAEVALNSGHRASIVSLVPRVRDVAAEENDQARNLGEKAVFVCTM